MKDGTPILMYHGTDGKFEAFDRRYIGAHGSFEGAGFNFAASESRAKEYANGGNVLEGWLSIQKPISTTRKTISVNKLIDIIRKIDPTGDNVVGNYGAKDFSDYGKPSFVQRESVTAAKNIWNYAESNADIYAYLSQFNSDTESLIKAFQDEGFDGVIHYNNDGSIKTAIIFEATQFKSSDNIGLFDPKQPKFRYSIMDKDFRMEQKKPGSIVRTFKQNETTANVIGSSVELKGGTIRQRVAMMKLLAEHNDLVRVDAASTEEAEAFRRAGAVQDEMEGRGKYGTFEFKYQRQVGQDICDPKQKVKFAKDIVKYKMPGIAA